MERLGEGLSRVVVGVKGRAGGLTTLAINFDRVTTFATHEKTSTADPW